MPPPGTAPARGAIAALTQLLLGLVAGGSWRQPPPSHHVGFLLLPPPHPSSGPASARRLFREPADIRASPGPAPPPPPPPPPPPSAAATAVFAAQPLVWASLLSVATSGAGLPPGPGGSLGALEGIAYLMVAGAAIVGVDKGEEASSSLRAAAVAASRVTVVAGLAVLAALAAERGCVPNARPILDYSAYLPVCSS